MSYKATMEFGLHLHEFNNVDLFQQGIYYLRLSLHHKDSKGRAIYAQPYNQVQCEENPSITQNIEKKVRYLIPFRQYFTFSPPIIFHISQKDLLDPLVMDK